MSEPEEDKPEERRSILDSLRPLLPYAREYRGRIALVILGSTIFGILRLARPNIIKAIIDDVLTPLFAKTISAESAYVLAGKLGLLLFAIDIGASILFGTYSYISHYVASRMHVQIFRKAIAHLQALDMKFHTNQNSGELMARVERGIEATTEALHENIAKVLLPSVTNIICIMGLALYQNWRLTLAGIAFLLPHIYISYRQTRPIKSNQGKINKLHEKVSHRTYEGIYNMEAVIACNAGNQELAHFDASQEKIIALQDNTAFLWRIQGVSSAFFNGLSGTAIIIAGVWVIAGKYGTVGDFVKFLAYMAMLYQPIQELVHAYLTMQIKLAKIDRLSTFLDRQPVVQELDGAIGMPPLRHQIELKNISFAYSDGKDTISDISLIIPAGKKVALVGPTGTGKSTLVNLVQRYYDPTQGIIAFDGTDIRRFTLRSLHEQIAIVPQHAFLFSRSIAENIAYGRPEATEAEIVAAAKIANAHEFIVLKDDEYNAVIGEHGVKLSGGEQQRLSIARAVVRNASLIILDEATSHLDAINERLVQDALWKLMEDRTAIIIAHRFSTIINADIIVVMDQGKILDQGTHKELLERCQLYQNLYNHQFENQTESPSES